MKTLAAFLMALMLVGCSGNAVRRRAQINPVDSWSSLAGGMYEGKTKKTYSQEY